MNHATHVVRASALALLVAAGLALAAPGRAADEATELTGVVNVNTATVEELQLLPGIGESRARALIEARKQLGGFKSVEQLVEVKGIGPAALERLRPFVSVSGKTTARAE
jgi:competence protein ComEA